MVIPVLPPEELEEEDCGLTRNEKHRHEAASVSHKLTHLPKNGFCEACQMGKMKEKYSRRGAFNRALARWGDLVTFDHLYSGSYRATGLGGEREGFVIKDVYTGLLHVYPVEDKSSTGWRCSSDGVPVVESVTVMAAVTVPAVVGLPVIAPPVLMERPAGRPVAVNV